MRTEIRIAGFGGQGIVLAGVILGDAAGRTGHHAVQTQSYGPESRGGAARSEVIVASEPIDYPRVTSADCLVALSQPAFEKYKKMVRAGGHVITDSNTVETEASSALPFTRTAEQVGLKIVANIVMVGYVGALLDLFDPSLLEEAVLRRVPAGTEDLNRRALQAGRELLASH